MFCLVVLFVIVFVFIVPRVGAVVIIFVLFVGVNLPLYNFCPFKLQRLVHFHGHLVDQNVEVVVVVCCNLASTWTSVGQHYLSVRVCSTGSQIEVNVVIILVDLC